jgi:hypothetical protein
MGQLMKQHIITSQAKYPSSWHFEDASEVSGVPIYCEERKQDLSSLAPDKSQGSSNRGPDFQFLDPGEKIDIVVALEECRCA